MVRILILMVVPFVCFSQINPREDIPNYNLLKEKENLDTKRKASYNLDEIKVRWYNGDFDGWDGNINGYSASTGVYWYVVQLDKGSIPLRGNFTLIR